MNPVNTRSNETIAIRWRPNGQLTREKIFDVTNLSRNDSHEEITQQMKTKAAEKVDGKAPLFIAGGSVVSPATIQISNEGPK